MHAVTKYDFYFLKGEKAAYQGTPVKKTNRLFNRYKFPKREFKNVSQLIDLRQVDKPSRKRRCI